jgi:GT2 family glycosyltransferase
MRTSVAIVIPSWEGRALLETCLPAVFASTVPVEVLVVDNGSTDGTRAWLRRTYPQIQVISNPVNFGFAKAVNQGIRASHAEWVALLNNDAVPNADWIAQLLEVGSFDERIGAVASRMMFRDTPHVVSSLGIRVDGSGGAWDLCIGETRWPTQPIEIFGASGGACLYRRKMLEDVGLFDERFFAYFEDVDLAWRAQWRRWKTRLSPNAVVYHALSATLGEQSPFKRYYLGRNRWRVIVKNYPAELLLRNCLTLVAYDALSIAKSIVGRDTDSVRGRLSNLADFRLLLRQRRAISATRLASWREIRSALSPLESPITLLNRVRRVNRLTGSASDIHD